MAIGRRLLWWMITAALILLLLAGGFLFTRHWQRQAVPVLSAVPPGTLALVVPSGMNRLDAVSGPEQALRLNFSRLPLATAFFNAVHTLDSLSSSDETVRNILVNHDLLLAWVRDGDTSAGLLVLAEVKDYMEGRLLHSFLSGQFGVSLSDPGGTGREIYRMAGQDPFYFAIHKGVFMGSPSPGLVAMAMKQADSREPAFPPEEFREVMQTAGKNVDANIFLDLNTCKEVFYPGDERPQDYRPVLSSGFASLDLAVTPEGLLFSGFLAPEAAMPGLNEVFRQQEAAGSDISSLLPFNTVSFVKIGFSDFDKLYDERVRMNKQLGSSSPVTEISESDRPYFSGWLHREITLARLPGGHRMAILKSREDVKPLEELSGLLVPGEVTNVDGVPVFKISKEGIIRDLLWPFSAGTDMPYVMQWEDRLIFTDAVETLKELTRSYRMGKSLAGSAKYRNAAENITEKAHIYFYLDLEKEWEEMDGTNPPLLSSGWKAEDGSHKHFPTLTVQLTQSGKWMFASLFLSHTDTLIEESSYAWKIRLNDRVVGGPRLVRGFHGSSRHIWVTDTNHMLHLVSGQGKMLWQRQMEGTVLGEVSSIRMERAETVFVSNTASNLYLVDSLGKELPGFPVSLEADAATGHCLVNYADNGSKRILIPARDKKIYNYDLLGKKVDGWKYPELHGMPRGEPQHLVTNRKDYLVFTDEEGNVMITDRLGKERMKFRGKFSNGVNSAFYINQTNSKGLFITTDDKGHLIYFPEKGKIQKTVFEDFSSGHYFFYTDIDGNGMEDFVYFDHQEMKAFDRFKKLLVEAPLPEPPAYKPLNIPWESKQKSFFFRGNSGRVYLVGPTGQVMTEEELATDSQFSAWPGDDQGVFYILVSKEKTIRLLPYKAY